MRVSFIYLVVIIVFFKQKTAYEMRISDWSSDVCSSDLIADARVGADSEALAATIDHARADAHVILFERAGEIGQVQPKCSKPLDVGNDLKLLHMAADRIDAGKARRILQQRRDDPVLCGSQVGRLIGLRDKPVALEIGRTSVRDKG